MSRPQQSLRFLALIAGDEAPSPLRSSLADLSSRREIEVSFRGRDPTYRRLNLVFFGRSSVGA